MTTQVITQKRGRGRPWGPSHNDFNFHCDSDLYQWMMQTKPEGMSLTRYLNNLIRERAGL